jgi:hypothetical protein
MTNSHVSRQAIELGKSVAEGSVLTLVTVIASITAATLIYAWFFT